MLEWFLNIENYQATGADNFRLGDEDVSVNEGRV